MSLEFSARVPKTRISPLLAWERSQAAKLSGSASHFSFAVLRPFFFRIDSPLSLRRCALWTSRSQIASASVSSPMKECQKAFDQVQPSLAQLDPAHERSFTPQFLVPAARVPMLRLALDGHDGRAHLVAILQDLTEVTTLLRVERAPEVIDDQELELG